MTDDALVAQLKAEDNAAFGLLYRFYFTSVTAFVTQNAGTTADAEDLFQEAIIVLLGKVRQPDFELTCSLKTYLYAIVRNQWLKRLRDNKLTPVDDLEACQPRADVFADGLAEAPNREEQVGSWLTKITQRCQLILKALFFHREPMDSLMKTMGWKNKHSAANQKYRCLEELKKEKDRHS